MDTPAPPEARKWLDAEVELAEARMAALDLAMSSAANVLPWLESLERQQVQATITTLQIRRQREEVMRDAYDANLRRLAQPNGT